jgi:sentrin-specific protease 1
MFSSFFYTRLSDPKHSYDGVRRWTRRAKLVPNGPADVFAFDMVLFPINVNASHWVCACIDFRHKTIA